MKLVILRLLTVGVMLILGQATAFAVAPDILWTRTYGGVSTDRCRSLIVTTDGNLLLAGDTYSFGFGWCDGWTLEVDANGDSLWSSAYGGASCDGFHKAIAMADGGFFYVGTTYGGLTDGWAQRTDAFGNVLWSNAYGSSNEDRLHDGIRDSDGNFVLAGFTEARGVSDADFWLIKVDPFGNTIFDRSYYNRGWCISVVECDGGYLLAGETNLYGAGGFDGWILKTNRDGDSLWSRAYGGAGDDGFDPVIPTTDGNFLLCGYTNSFGAGGGDVWMMKISPDGDSLWSNTHGGPQGDGGSAIQAMPNGGYLVAGSTRSFGAGSGDLWLVRTDADGDSLWSLTLGGPGDESDHLAPSILLAESNSILVAAHTPSFGAGNEDFWLIKLALDDESLPVELMSFNAIPEVDAIRLTFSTAAETDNDFFEIWRGESVEGSFNRIAVLPSQGSSTSGHHYEYLDREVSTGPTYWYYLVDVDVSANRTEHRDGMVSAAAVSSSLPADYTLTAFPNPFNPTVQIRFGLPAESHIELVIFNSLGQEVATLLNQVLNAGSHTAEWNGRSNTGIEQASGVYLFQMRAGGFTQTQKLILMR